MKAKTNSKRLISLILSLILLLQAPYLTAFANTKQGESMPITLNAKAQYIANTYQNVDKLIYGKSAMGKDLEAYRVRGVGKNNKTIFCNFAIHGFEDFYYRDGQYLTEAANNLIEYLAQYPTMLKDFDIIIVPCANPDGTIDGVNDLRACEEAFGRCTSQHIDMNRDFVKLEAQETRALKSLMDKTNPYVFIDFHGWLDEVLGDKGIVNAFRSTNNISRDKSGVFAYHSGYAYGYAHQILGSRAALVEFKHPDQLNHAKIAEGLAKVISSFPTVTNSWGVNRYGTCHINGSGNFDRSNWAQDQYDWCYLNWDGTLATNAWVKDFSGENVFVDENGHITRNTWKHDGVDWFYLNTDGRVAKNEWATDFSGQQVLLNSNGYITRNSWEYDGSEWFYLDEDGRPLKNAWATDFSGSQVYLNEYGHITRNSWKYIDSEWCYLDVDGRITKNDWATDFSGSPVYMDINGHITRSSWANDGEHKFLTDEDGHTLKEQWIEDDTSKLVYLDSNGFVTTNDWAYADSDWVYLDNNGHITLNSFVYDFGGNKVYVGADGYIVRSQLIVFENGKKMFVDEDGRTAKDSWFYDGIDWAHTDKDGYLIINAWATDFSGNQVYLGDKGYITRNNIVPDANGKNVFVDDDGHTTDKQIA